MKARLALMASITYDRTKTMKASCIMTFKLRHDRARLDSIFSACGNLLVLILFHFQEGEGCGDY